ncbi:hypothetical protein ACR2R6_06990 [Methylocaldum gracile subsp. desertum]|uniref:hypothetical protein n=1 Tax=Methylocaldum sp. GT1BW TaxID=3438964 RepID=UPI003DA0C280
MDKEIVRNLLAKIGYLLLDVQSTERAIRLCAKVALPKLEQLLTGLGERLQNEEYEHRTIGQMLRELRKRAAFQSDFEEVLERFLKHRNFLAHDLANTPGWNMKTQEGVEASNAFLNELLKDSRLVRSVFVGIINAWRVQSGIEVDDEEFARLNIPDTLQRPIVKDVYIKKNA